MRVLMVIPQLFYSARGTPLSAYHRIKDLVGYGHKVEVLTYKPGAPLPDLPEVVVHRSFGPHFWSTLKQGPSYVKMWFDLLLFLTLIGRLARGRYDVVYAHEEGGFLGALVAPLFGVPLVYDLHSSLPLQIRDWGFSNREWVVDLFRFVERFTLRRAVAAVSISPGVTRAALDAWPQAKVVTILNRFELDVQAAAAEGVRLRRELGLSPEDKLVLYTGSFVPLQALDLLIDAVPFVRDAAPEARFVLVGGQPNEIAELGAQAKRLGVTDLVQLLPLRPQSEMPAFMAACNVLVSPRKKGINPPGKLFSYLSSGRPLVATDCPIHNQLLDASCSILTAPDPRSFAEGIVTALRDSARVEAVTTHAAEILRTKYSPDARARAYEELFRLVEAA